MPDRAILQDLVTQHVHVAWLKASNHQMLDTALLLDTFAEIGFDVQIMSNDDTSLAAMANFDLIVFNAGNLQSDHICSILLKIRAASLAPLIVLTNEPAEEQVVAVLQTGADAVLSLDVPAEVMVAHCKALLRRYFRRL
jgi:DNA-binding response OmpR family regulator